MRQNWWTDDHRVHTLLLPRSTACREVTQSKEQMSRSQSHKMSGQETRRNFWTLSIPRLCNSYHISCDKQQLSLAMLEIFLIPTLQSKNAENATLLIRRRPKKLTLSVPHFFWFCQKWVYQSVQRHTDLTHPFNLLTFGYSGAQSCPNVKKIKKGGSDQYGPEHFGV